MNSTPIHDLCQELVKLSYTETAPSHQQKMELAALRSFEENCWSSLKEPNPSPPENQKERQLFLLNAIDRELSSIDVAAAKMQNAWKKTALAEDKRVLVRKLLARLHHTTQDPDLKNKITEILAHHQTKTTPTAALEKIALKHSLGLAHANENLKIKLFTESKWGSRVREQSGVYWVKDEELPVGNMAVGKVSTQGARPYMEDRTYAGFCGKELKLPLLAVFDGHSGSGCAAFLKEHLSNTLTAEISESMSPIQLDKALSLVFPQLEEQFRKRKSKDDHSGATALAALVIGETLYVFNAGDSRAIVVTPDGSIQQLTDDAKPDKARFERSIKKRGGHVKKDKQGPSRVNGRLAVARSVEGSEIKGVTATGIVTTLNISALPKGTKLILATDGLWDVGNSLEVGKTVFDMMVNGKSRNPEIAENLVLTAFKSGSQDNISVIVADLK